MYGAVVPKAGPVVHYEVSVRSDCDLVDGITCLLLICIIAQIVLQSTRSQSLLTCTSVMLSELPLEHTKIYGKYNKKYEKEHRATKAYTM